MDGAAKFVRGDAIAGLIITVINIVGGLTIGVLRHGMAIGDAFTTFTTLTVGDGLVTQIPALLVSTAAGIVVTKGGIEGTADKAIVRQLGASPKALAIAGGAALLMSTAARPAGAAVPDRWRPGRWRRVAALRRQSKAAGAKWRRASRRPRRSSRRSPSPCISTRCGWNSATRLLGLASGDTARLTEQIKVLRKTFATEMGFILPPVRVQDNMELRAQQLLFPHQGDGGRAAASCGRACCWR